MDSLPEHIRLEGNTAAVEDCVMNSVVEVCDVLSEVAEDGDLQRA